MIPVEDEIISIIAEMRGEEIPSEELNLLKEFRVPHTERAIILRVHNSLAGHHGVERTMKKLVEANYHWPYMREHVKWFIRHCPLCQKMSQLKSPIHAIPYTTAAYDPFKRINIDSIGPLTTSDGRVWHILVIIDCFSRWVELFALPDLTMDTVELPLLQYFGRYGTAAQVLTDNGTQFNNKVVTELLFLSGNEHVRVLAYSKEENSIVERANKEVMRHHRALIFGKNIDTAIPKYLMKVQRIMNASVVSSTGSTPADIIFGNSVSLDRGIFLPENALPLSKENMPLSIWQANHLRDQQRVIAKARTLQREKDTEHIASYPKLSPTDFKVGSFVLVEYPGDVIRRGPDNKLLTMLKGPFKIVNEKETQ